MLLVSFLRLTGILKLYPLIKKNYPPNENVLLSTFAFSIPRTTGGGTKRGNQLINFLVL